ncbi:flagellar basal body P-ring formation chaperone FlgA [Alcaligenes sp. SDU_A2]|uniref:flagellar basal body P-ring formation chaperone FlgA n=1 Tax=Alcaligenes sp. SDU_A2 TaxID=3136634 RepID=UPI00311EE559
MTPTRLFPLVLLPALFLAAPASAQQQQQQQQPAIQSVQDMQTLAHDYLLSQVQILPGQAHITLDASRLQAMPACQQAQAFLPSGQRLRARMSVGIRCLAPQPWSSSVSATLAVQGHYYVTNRRINPGETISLDDLVAREGDLLQLSPGVVFDPSQLVGYVASQRITMGAPIRSSALRDPQSVMRGQTVRTIARGAGFVATGEGQALQNGAPGTQIQIKASSGQIISATVLDASTVQVMM